MRPIKASDKDLLEAFHARQSPESIYLRFFQFRPKLSSKELEYLTEVDYVRRMAFVALVGGELVAVARYEGGDGGDRPEVAFFVDDDHQGRGLGTLMLEYLAAAARSQGIEGFSGAVLPENHAMLGLFKRAGFTLKTWFEDGAIGVDLDISVTTEVSDAVARRQQRARSRSVARFLSPASVAVVGASRRPGSVGHELLRQLIDGGFTGRVHPVNPSADEILGHRATPTLTAIGEPVDLAVVVVPAAEVEAVVREAAAVPVGGLLVVSSGFSDSSAAGADLERRLVGIARSNGMRLVGPSSLGLINTDPGIRLRAVMLPVGPEEGAVGLVSQSGPLGAGVLENLRSKGVGVSSFIGAGNRADVSINDVLDYWMADEATRVAMLYVENYGNLRHFALAARSLSASKPIVTLRPPDHDLVELMSQAGVVLTNSVAEMVAVAQVAAEQPVPAGPRVVVVSNTASVARLAVAACQRAGLTTVIPEGVDPDVDHRAQSTGAVLVGDLDQVSTSGRRLDYEAPLVAAAVSEGVDAVLAAVVPSLDLSIERLGRILGRVNRSIDKPVVAAGLIGAEQLTVPGLPLYDFPDEAARALGHLARYGRWQRENPEAEPLVDDEQVETATQALRPMVLDLLKPPPGSDASTSTAANPAAERLPVDLLSADATALVEALDLPEADWRVVNARDELAAAADSIGYPVAIKAGRVDQRTVGEVGGVAIDIHDRVELLAAFDRMAAARPHDALPVVVQAMVPSVANAGIELVQDPRHVAFIRVGLGGSAGSTLEPAARRFLPLAAGDDAELVGALKTVLALDESSRQVIASIIRRLAVIGAAVPELARLRLNPVLVAGSATAVGDATIEVRETKPDPLAGVRRL